MFLLHVSMNEAEVSSARQEWTTMQSISLIQYNGNAKKSEFCFNNTCHLFHKFQDTFTKFKMPHM